MKWVDVPLAVWLHQPGESLRPFFAGVMLATDYLSWLFHVPSLVGVPGAWLLLLLLFLLSWVRRLPHATIWLVVLLTMVGSEGLGNLLKLFSNRPRPLDVFAHHAPNASFWQPVGRFDAFPSGHTAWVAGLLLPLALRFPKLRPTLLGLVGLVAAGRVALEAHWLSDVVGAGYLALLLACSIEIGTWWLRPKPAGAPAPNAR
ncbi:phosphatase PAP2 family protein [Hymenobacter sp. 5516J-16]|uniref:phosphatase PAP2 family protein n=1 Tax=Hymenobacter sp. 5516J-16 TaxID=2932253 RepID=UPI001FD3F6D4|nr:phosphatase PAP2 family protein [Hymenobacter sp. 5516J-16]UOQ76306.1 phosphatase PAP2 family protein [Hymenobacter sp. 5516J-16]